MKMRSIQAAAMLLGLLLAFPFAFASLPPNGPASRSVLFVLSSEGRDAGQMRPGFEIDELAQAWNILKKSGVRTAIASPRDGRVETDEFDAKNPDNARLLSDPEAGDILSR